MVSDWNAPAQVGPNVNSSSADHAPYISSDGLTLYFASNRAGGSGTTDLWQATRASLTSPWTTPTNLGPLVNRAYVDQGPSVSPDGLMLFFSSDRPGGFGGYDIWMSTRTSQNDPWGAPVNLGPSVNTSSNDGGTSMSSDETTLYFDSNRPGGSGGYDLWQVSVTVAPEPSSFALLAGGAIILFLYAWRRRK